MSPVRQQLEEVIDYLPEHDLTLLLEIAKRFVPDDAATPDDLKAIQEANEEYAQGKTISHDSIQWD